MKLKETTKLFPQMGLHVNIVVTKKTQRGIVARRFLTKLEKYEMDKFTDNLVKINFPEVRQIPVKVGGRIVSYL